MWTLTLLFLVFACCVWTSGGLKCLQCMDPSPGGPCINDYEGLTNPRNASNTYDKECPDGSFGVTLDYCVIEAFYVGGILKSFIRDCSDGSNFSFTEDVDSTKLQQIVPDNYTTCVYRISANAHICVSLCNEDYCNGPLPPQNDTVNCTYDNDSSTCSADRLLAGVGPFGPIADRVLGRGYFLPMVVAILCLLILG